MKQIQKIIYKNKLPLFHFERDKHIFYLFLTENIKCKISGTNSICWILKDKIMTYLFKMIAKI